MTNYSRTCYRLAGGMIEPIRKYFIDLKNELQIAGMNFTLDEYLSMALFTSVVLFVLESALLGFVFGLFIPNIFLVVPLAVTLSFSMSVILFFIFYSYPKTISKRRAEQIDSALPFAISYMSAIASGNAPPYFMFRTISRIKDYGEIAKEAGIIARNMKMFGMNFSDSIKRESSRTPSKNMKEILWGINTTLLSGGDLKTYLREKADILIDEYRRKIRKYSQDLGMLVEIYLTLIIVGSIFFIVLTSIMGGGADVIWIQFFIVFIFLPLMSIGFIALVKMRSPIK